MEAVAVSALLNILVPKLMEVYTRNRDLQKGLKAEIEHIKYDLVIMRATIEDNHNWGTRMNSTREAWIKAVHKFAQDTDDCVDLFLHRAARKRLSREEFARKIRELKTTSKAIQARNPWPARQGEEAAASEEESYQDRNDYPSGLVGMEAPITRLLELVGQPTVESESKSPLPLPLPLERQPKSEIESLLPPVPLGQPAAHSKKVKRKVISVVGFGGLGKTRLAYQVYNHPDVIEQFPLRAWVRAASAGALEVLQNISMELDDQIKDDTRRINGDTTICKLSKHVESCLKGKRYCIVIDDIRTTGLWRVINSAFPQQGADSRIIVTTTMQPVANACTLWNGSVYKMPTLSSEMSQRLFLELVPLDQRPDRMNDGLTGLLKKCDGLPLALISVLEYLKSKGNHIFKEETCKEACRRFRTCLMEDLALGRMKGVLVKKYNCLPDHGVKACLLYFYLFPSDDPIRRGSLTRQCLAEGFIKEKALDTLQKVVAGYLETLVEHNIILPIQVSNNERIKSCRPHGIVREYISYKSISENFITLLCGQNETPKGVQMGNVRRLSLHHGAADNKNCIKDIDLSLLRTLAVSGKACEEIMDFSKYKLLRVLDLKRSDYQLKGKQLDDICTLLLLLKYLSLGNLKETISNLPRVIGRLILLETLQTRISEEPVGLYEEVIKLPNLKHLIGKFKFVDTPHKGLAKFLSENSILETLSGFVTGNSRGFARLMNHMMHLRKVKIWYNSTADQENLNDLSQAIKEFTREGTDMDRSLSIDLAIYSEVILNAIKDEGTLTSLKLSGDLTNFLCSPERKYLTGLVCIQELCLSWTQLTGGAILSSLSNLVTLKDVKLVENDLGPLVLGSDGFKSLERLCLVCEARLDITIEDEALPRLVSFHMICEAGGSPSGIQIGGLTKLNEIALHPRVHPIIKQEWKEAAQRHPNRPNVLLFDSKPSVQGQHNPIIPTENARKKQSSGIAKFSTMIMERIISKRK